MITTSSKEDIDNRVKNSLKEIMFLINARRHSSDENITPEEALQEITNLMTILGSEQQIDILKAFSICIDRVVRQAAIIELLEHDFDYIIEYVEHDRKSYISYLNAAEGKEVQREIARRSPDKAIMSDANMTVFMKQAKAEGPSSVSLFLHKLLNRNANYVSGITYDCIISCIKFLLAKEDRWQYLTTDLWTNSSVVSAFGRSCGFETSTIDKDSRIEKAYFNYIAKKNDVNFNLMFLKKAIEDLYYFLPHPTRYRYRGTHTEKTTSILFKEGFYEENKEIIDKMFIEHLRENPFYTKFDDTQVYSKYPEARRVLAITKPVIEEHFREIKQIPNWENSVLKTKVQHNNKITSIATYEKLIMDGINLVLELDKDK